MGEKSVGKLDPAHWTQPIWSQLIGSQVIGSQQMPVCQLEPRSWLAEKGIHILWLAWFFDGRQPGENSARLFLVSCILWLITLLLLEGGRFLTTEGIHEIDGIIPHLLG